MDLNILLNNIKKNNMEDRIQINGEWYIKEPTEITPKELDLAYAEMCSYEVLDYCFDATRMFKDYDSSEFYKNEIEIKFTDKRTKTWKVDNWDSVAWLIDVYKGNKDAINDASELMGTYGIMELKNFIGHLIKIGWITYE